MLIKNANVWPHPVLLISEWLGGGAQQSVLTFPLGDSDAMESLRTTNLGRVIFCFFGDFSPCKYKGEKESKRIKVNLQKNDRTDDSWNKN